MKNMKYTKTENKFVIKIEKGEELFPTLIDFCKKEEIKYKIEFHHGGFSKKKKSEKKN